MKILVLTSGGDAPGMNMVLYLLQRRFIGRIYACRAGFKGLVNNDIITLSAFKPHKHMFEAGSAIKSSRYPQFNTKEGFEKALENARRFDCLIILGGNGSYKGALQLAENGIKTVFIPSTIDNDVEISEYSQGFHTAVSACCDYIDSVMPTMEAFDRCCIFETMGRKCGKIASEVFNIKKSDYLVQEEADIDYDKIAEIVRKKNGRGEASSIILRENIVKIDDFIKNLGEKCPKVEIKGCVIGYLQRGTKPTKVELDYAKQFAKGAINAVFSDAGCSAIVYRNKKFEIIESLKREQPSKKKILIPKRKKEKKNN